MTDFTVAEWQADQTTLDAGPAFGINDLATNISAALDALNGDSHITEIVISDNSPVVVNVGQLSSDAASLSLLVNANSTAATLTVSDVAANISNGFANIASSPQVATIVITDSATHTVSLTASEFVSDNSTVAELREADGTTPATVNVLDTATNLAANLDALENHVGEINQIVVSDSHPLTLSASEIADDSSALALVVNHNGGGVTFDVSDTAANISANLDALAANADIVQITISDNQAVKATVAQISSDASVLSELQNANSSSVVIDVQDTAADIQASLSSLNSDSGISSIIISDNNAITLSVAQLGADSTALGKLQNLNASPYSLVISDNSTNIGGALGTLNSNTHVSSIVITNNASIAVNVAQITSDATALSKLIDRNGSAYTLTVSDTASDISGAFDALSGNSHVTRIVVSDSGSNEVKITAAQAAADGAALGELFQSDGVTAAQVEVLDSASNISGAFDALNGNSHVNKIVVSDSATNEVTITASQAATDTAALGELFRSNGTTHAHVEVLDSASDITGALDALNGNTHVNKIVVSNSVSAEVTVSVAQLTSDATALNELFKADGTTQANVTVSDTAANIATAIGSLNGNSQVNKIIVGDSATNEVTITAAQAAADSTVLGELFLANGTTHAQVEVSDTASNISGAFDALNGNSHVGIIVVSDSTTSQVIISAAQAGTDGTALSELFKANGTTPAQVEVSDTASNISGAFDALNGNSHVNKIVVNDSGANEVTITAAQAAADGTALGELLQSDGATAAQVEVLDTASNISGALDALNGNGHVNKIVVSDSAMNEVTITASQAATDTTALGELFLANGATHAHVEVLDTASDITGALDALTGNTHVNKIVVSDSASNEVTVSVAQLTSDAAALGELFKADGTTQANITVSDTAANIATALASLNSNGQVNKIIVSDSGTNEVTITAAQAAADSTVLGELFLVNGTTAAHVEVSDTAANISSALGALNSNTHVNKIVVSDSTTNQVTITAAQAAADGTALGELFLANGTTHAQVEVSDTASNISGALNALNGNSHVGKIVVSDSASNEVIVSVAQLTSDATALSELFKANGTTAATIEVSDTAANIASALAAINGNTQVNKIVVSDSAANEVTITAAQAAADSTVLGELFQANGISHADVEVSDTAANIITALAALNGNTNVNKIVINDGGTVIVSVAQLTSDATAIGELFLTNGTTHAQVEVSDTAADISSAIDALNNNSHVGKIVISDSSKVIITVAQAAADGTALGELFLTDGTTHATVTVSDTAADISAAFDALNGNTHVGGIVVSDSGSNEVTLTAAQAATDTTALGLLFQSDGTTPAQVAVSDTASNISSVFNTLNGNSHVNKIVVSDSASNEVAITAAQAAADGTALGELFQANGISHADVEVSDTAANITSALAALNGDSQVNKVVVSDSATNEVTVSVAQLTSDANLLSELFKANGTTQATVEVSDTAANITTALAALNGNSQVNKIVINNGGTVIVNVSQLTSDATAIGELFLANGTTHAQVEVSDTAADISAAFDALSANSHVGKIVISDSATNQVILTAAQAAADGAALGELFLANGTTHAQVEVSDTAADISAAFDGLNNTHIGKIVIGDSATHEVTITAAQAGSDGTALSNLFQSDGTTAAQVEVADTAADISAALNALSGNGHVNKIVVSDSATNEVTVSVAQLTSDATAIGELFLANGTTQAKMAVSDTAADITAALSALNGDSQIDNIVVSDNAALTLSVSQLATDAIAIGELHNQNSSPVVLNISDSASHVGANIDLLETDAAKIGSISFTNSGTPTLAVTQTQDTNDASVIAKIVGAYDLHVTNVTGHSYTSFTDFFNASNVLTLTTEFNKNGSITDIAHTSGLSMTGTSGADTFDVLAGHSDTIKGGNGADTFQFTSVSESTSTNYDTIVGFNASQDKFDFSALSLKVTGINATVKGALSTAHFDANLTSALNSSHLSADHAVLFTVTSGSLKGDTFLVVDANGHAGYQAGHDLVFLISDGTHLSSLSTGDFI